MHLDLRTLNVWTGNETKYRVREACLTGEDEDEQRWILKSGVVLFGLLQESGSWVWDCGIMGRETCDSQILLSVERKEKHDTSPSRPRPPPLPNTHTHTRGNNPIKTM